MKKIASGLVSVAVAIVVPGGFFILLCYYLNSRRRKLIKDTAVTN
jgi:hypothetical protein